MTHEDIEKTPVCKAMFVDVASALKQEGLDVTIFSASDNFVDDQKSYNDGIDYKFFKRRSYGKISFSALISLLGACGQFLSIIRNHDIIFFRSYPTILFFGFFAKLLGKKIIFDTRGLFFEELLDSGKLNAKYALPFLRFLEKRLLLLSSVVICVTESQKEYYLSLLGTRKTRMVVIHNCAPLAPIVEDRTKSSNLELVYVGSLVRWHSPELVKEVCLELERMNVPYSLTVLTRDLSRAESLFSCLGEKVIIRSHNFRDNPIRFDYGFCLISGGLSKKVCFPVKFLEYIQSGTKVINSDNVDVTTRIINDEGGGINVDLNSLPSDIAKSIICNWNENRRRYPKLGDAYSFKSQVEKVIGLVRSVS